MTQESLTADIEQGTPLPEIREIGFDDLNDALSKGLQDFMAKPTHLFFVFWIYPLVMIIVIRAFAGGAMLPLTFPILAGYTLFGPVVATGMYEISRRRELGLDDSRKHIFTLFSYKSIWPITRLAVILAVVYFAWLMVAFAIYEMSFSGVMPQSLAEFVDRALYTPAGITMILIGSAVGLLFAIAVFVCSVVSFPMLVDREVRARDALRTSVKACLKNPLTMAIWGVIVAVALFVAALPLLLGLTIVMPVLGHATWHVYRKMVGD